MACKHTSGMAFIPQPFRCDSCTDEELQRYKQALQKIVNRTWELGDYLPREILEDIMRIVNAALKGSVGPK